MSSVGSISEQTLAGVVTTATHGSGINYGVISTNVMAMSLLLADGSRLTCSRNEHADIFMASICGLGATGIILSVQLEVEPAFKLRELQQSLPFDDVVQNIDKYARSAEHARFWWFPTQDIIRASYCNRSDEVCPQSSLPYHLLDASFRTKTRQAAGGGIPSSDIISFNSCSLSHDISISSTTGLPISPVGL